MADTIGPDLHVVPPVAKTGRPRPDAPDAAPDADGRLSPREIRFVEAIAGGDNSCQASAKAGVSGRTGRRWRQRSEIQAAVRARLNDSLASARAILAQGSARAARSLVAMSDDEADATGPKVAASRAVIEQATNLAAVEELASRLAELEARIEQQPPPGAAGCRGRI